ncbi:MAG: TetR/AcrR family transcriptional regulator C-terminal domain-containing protein [Chloroflexi bacterium]|nr:TetR/AcrR family transcriptional regulator C-terminal domain-containing protein [Chloroflexota bacterium]MBV9597946.1 TetR/AcrR family transcriptional regulator C-terminal domain-containing protein [Chloroflexota bacterium]
MFLKVMHPPLPAPPWRADTRGRAAPPRAPITREAILDAAARILDQDGIDGLSMRRVADELHTGPASLYWHVRNKEELLQLLFERINDEIELPAPDPAHWQAQLKLLGRQVRAAAHRHRDYARLSLGRIPSGPSLARFAEWLFQLLGPVGVPDKVIAYCGDLFSLYVGAFAFEESLGPSSPTGEPMPAEQIAEMFRDYLRSLPASQFPNVHRKAGLLFGGDADERFEFGMEVLIRGIESYVSDAPVSGM